MYRGKHKLRRTAAQLTVTHKGTTRSLIFKPRARTQGLLPSSCRPARNFRRRVDQARMRGSFKFGSIAVVDFSHGVGVQQRFSERDALTVPRISLPRPNWPRLVRVGEIPLACFCTAWCFCSGTRVVCRLTLKVARSGR